MKNANIFISNILALTQINKPSTIDEHKKYVKKAYNACTQILPM